METQVHFAEHKPHVQAGAAANMSCSRIHKCVPANYSPCSLRLPSNVCLLMKPIKGNLAPTPLIRDFVSSVPTLDTRCTMYFLSSDWSIVLYVLQRCDWPASSCSCFINESGFGRSTGALRSFDEIFYFCSRYDKTL